MVFSSLIFVLLFLPVTLALYYLPFLSRSLTWQNSVLLLVSILFYAWGEGSYVLIMILGILFNWMFANLINRSATTKGMLLAVGVTGNLLLLCYFKYAAFLYDSLLPIVPALDTLSRPNVHLPIGISFFTFQAISYLIDVYRGEISAQKNPFKFALYITFFPHLIAGPIVRYIHIAVDIDNRKHTLRDFSYGAQRFIIGLGQKVLFANTLGEVADRVYQVPISELSMTHAWLGAICYTFQIYYDFCGYSNMAIGIARMFGFHFLENFNYPYISRSITEFWRRWHISLSTWFRDYVYIPLGGNRYGNVRTYRNLATVFLLCGLWHGASWNFVAWGALHGMLLIFERTTAGKSLLRLLGPLAHLYTLLLVVVSWVLFRVESLPLALATIGRMFGAGDPNVQILSSELISGEVLFFGLWAAVFACPVPRFLKRYLSLDPELQETPIDVATPTPSRAPSLFALVPLNALFLVSLSYLYAGSFNPFIYFRF